MIGYTRDSMGLFLNALVKVKSSQCARTQWNLWIGGLYKLIFFQAFDLFLRLFTKLADWGVDSRVLVSVRAFLVGRTQRV